MSSPTATTSPMHPAASKAAQTPAHPTALRAVVSAVLASVALAACGGGSDFGTGYPEVTIDSVTVDQAVVGALSTFTIKGSNLSQDFSLTTPSCDTAAVDVESTSDTERQVTCTIGSGGAVEVSIDDINASKTVYTNPNIANATSTTNVTAIAVEPMSPSTKTLATSQLARFTLAGLDLGKEKAMVVASTSCVDDRVILDPAADDAKTRTGWCTLKDTAAGALTAKAYYKDNLKGELVEAPIYDPKTTLGNVVAGTKPLLALSAENGVKVGNAVYSQEATFTFAGTNLANMKSVKSASCKGGEVTLSPVAQTDTTGNTREGKCIISEIGPIQIEAFDNNGTNAAYYGGYASGGVGTVPSPQISISTYAASITVSLDVGRSRKAVDNFLGLVNANYYDTTSPNDSKAVIHEIAKSTTADGITKVDFIRGGSYSQSEKGAILTARKPPTDGVEALSLDLPTDQKLAEAKGLLMMDVAKSDPKLSSRTGFIINATADAKYLGNAVFGQVVDADLAKIENFTKVGTETGTYAADNTKTATASVPSTPLVFQSIKQIQ